MSHEFVPAAVVLIGLAAVVTDLRSRRIPNALTGAAALGGLIFHVLGSGQDGALFSAAGWLVGLLLFLPFFIVRGMGAGDVKLLAALGAWLGAGDTLWLAAYSAVAGGVLGVATALWHGYLGMALLNIRQILSHWVTTGFKPVPGQTLESSASPRLAYAVPILAGVVVTLWL